MIYFKTLGRLVLINRGQTVQVSTWLTLLGVLVSSCLASRTKLSSPITTESQVTVDTLCYFDQDRHRLIPVAFYQLAKKQAPRHPPILIFSHGYGQNKGGDYLAYSYLTKTAAARGVFVVSIQHELPTDSLLPQSGIPQVVRRPFWERGVGTIYFVINQLKKDEPNLDFNQITLIGHSNGGDMTALFAHKYPHMVRRIITLDNRRMALPRTKQVAIYSLRSSDQVADAGVLPTEAERKRFRMTIVSLPNTKHDDTDDQANPKQRAQINQLIETFMLSKSPSFTPKP